jgi:hypothetical protein
MALFLTLLDRFKRKRMKKLALFLTDVKKVYMYVCIFIQHVSLVHECNQGYKYTRKLPQNSESTPSA